MAKPEIIISEQNNYKSVLLEIPGGVTTPSEFAEATSKILDQLPGDRVVLINGRGPTWAYGMLVHGAHATPAIAVNDPRLGYIVVATHDPRYSLGQNLGSEPWA